MSALLLLALLGAAEDAPLEDLGDRVRFGLSAGVGSLVPLKRVMLEGELRLGYVISSQFSAFAVGGASTGFGASWLFFVGGIVEFTPADWFYVGGGPLFGFGRVSASNLVVFNEPGLDSVAEADATGFGGAFKPGLELRLGFTTATARPPTFRRSGFTIGLDAKMFFHPDMKLGWSQGRGTTRESIITVTPMLVLGYDTR